MPQLPATVAIIIAPDVVYLWFAPVVVITAVVITVVAIIPVVVAAAVDVDVTLCRSLCRQRKPKTLNHVDSDFCLLFYYHTHVHILMY